MVGLEVEPKVKLDLRELWGLALLVKEGSVAEDGIVWAFGAAVEAGIPYP